MMRAMRLHGNSAEYIPIGVLLMGLYELDGGLPVALHVTGIALIVSRLIYIAGIWNSDQPTAGRGIGIVLTWVTVGALAVLNLCAERAHITAQCTEESMEQHKVVSHDEWIAARKAHLADEKAFTRARDALSRKRRELPWEKIEKNYVFDGPDGRKTLADLFGGKSQLIVYHFMLGPDWEEGCPSCSLLADHFDGAVIHLAQRDVAFAVVSRAPLAADRKIQAAHGLAFQMGVVVRQRFQFRLSRVGDAGGEGHRATSTTITR